MNSKVSIQSVMKNEEISKEAKVLFSYIHGGSSGGFSEPSYKFSHLADSGILSATELITAIDELVRHDLLEVTVNKGVM